ncbi:MFS transporter [Nocardioides sp. zg-536]|uniref:MFS transporter n=1 Tax=Nocardioides faecalis TaxID=2803858 RepID=A0A938XYZ6_9ACTN|nr:MFS transporter [Nocardioides faecalis]MBM9459077.1 MFS transporter [Nocardioides faecalis]MBS4753821.1 MFS transporter [Nocardioides faecalis]QVI57338.1 MFS transporter [Nocardioides faecalis]
MSMAEPIVEPEPLPRTREQRSWYYTDWAVSAFQTTVAGVLFAPYLISVAENAVGEQGRLELLGLSIAPGSLPSYVITLSTVLSAVLYPLLGAVADRTAHKTRLLAGFAWAGALATALLFFLEGENWLFGSLMFIVANLCGGAAVVVSDSILPLISTEAERDRVSSVGWAYGYAGGGLLLAVNFAMVTFHDALGLSTELAVRLSMLSAALWWAGFIIIPWRGIRDRAPVAVERVEGGLLARSFGQLAATLKDLRNYPVALTFLLAYLFFNDGIQTVIASASTFGIKELGFAEGTVLGTYLLVQFVAMFGAVGFGRAAGRFGAKKVILAGIVGWMGIVTVALVVPERQLYGFLLLGAAIGVVLGGTQALARSYFSLFIPRGKEAEYFSLYHAVDRGTSWFGTLTFGVVYQLTDSYRPAIFALIVFFVVGGLLLLRVNTAEGIRQAGNQRLAG